MFHGDNIEMKKIIIWIIMALVTVVAATALSPNNVTVSDDSLCSANTPGTNYNDVGYIEMQSGDDPVLKANFGVFEFDMSGKTWTQGNFSFTRDTNNCGGDSSNISWGIYYCDTDFAEGSITHTVWSGVARNCNTTPMGTFSRDEFQGGGSRKRWWFDLSDQAMNDANGLFTIMVNTTVQKTGAGTYCYISENDGVEHDAHIEYYDVPAPPVIPSTLNVSTDINPNGSQYNIQTINLNITNVNSSYDFSVYLIINDTVNLTRSFSAGKDIFVSFNQTFPEGDFNFSMRINNTVDAYNSSVNLFYIDTTSPGIVTTNFNLLSSFGYNNIIGQINFSDTNLWGINITIDDSTIVFNKTGITTSTYSYDLLFNPKDYGLTEGIHILNIWASDSHTTNTIPDYTYKKDLLTNTLTYEFGDQYIKISPVKDGLFSSLDTWKEKDRYVFKYERDFLAKLLYGNTMEFKVKSSDKLEIVEGSKYPGHIVSTSLEKWIDFNTIYPGATVTLELQNENEILVIVEGITEDDITFNSLGGLNVEQVNYTFYYGNVTETYTNNILETQASTFFINFTVNNSYVNHINATLKYEGVTYYPSSNTGSNYVIFSSPATTDLLTSGNATNHTFNWSYTINTPSTVITNTTTTQTRQVYRMIISKCIGDTLSKSINFTTMNITGVVMNSTMEIFFSLWNSSEALNREYGYEFSSSPYFGYCMLNHNLTINTNYEAEFTSPGYNSRSYIVSNGELTSGLGQITIEMDRTTSTTAITTTVADGSDQALPSYIVEVYLYDLSNNSYQFRDSKTTNSDGEAVFNLDVSLGQYLFYVKNSEGTIVYTEPKQTLTKTSYPFTVILGESEESILLKVKNLDYTFELDYDLENFTLTWDDSMSNLVDFVNLTIRKSNVTGDITVYSTVTSANEGLLYYNLSADGNYIGLFYTVATENTETYLIKSLSITIDNVFPDLGTDGLIFTFLFVGVLTFVALTISPEVSLIITVAALFLSWMIGLFTLVGVGGLINLLIAVVLIAVRLRNK